MVASLSPGLVSGLPPSPSVPAPSAGVWSPSCASVVPSVSLSASICPPPIIRVCRSTRAPVPCAPSPASLGPCDANGEARHGHALDIFTVSGACLKSSQTFAELEAALRGDERFLPCNRGVLVNMDEALKLDGDSILLTDGLRFPLRQRNRLDLVNRFSEYQIKRMKRG